MNIVNTEIDDVFEIYPEIKEDKRGRFVKTFYEPTYLEYGLIVDFKEEYYSVSMQNVLRGLHFQSPPMDHVKIVSCLYGSVIDVVLDIRKNSLTYGKYCMFLLDSQKANMIYIPKGMAHGFYVQSHQAIVSYKVSSVHSPNHDYGILWNSLGIPWPTEKPIVSDRDKLFVKFDDFNTPF